MICLCLCWSLHSLWPDGEQSDRSQTSPGLKQRLVTEPWKLSMSLGQISWSPLPAYHFRLSMTEWSLKGSWFLPSAAGFVQLWTIEAPQHPVKGCPAHPEGLPDPCCLSFFSFQTGIFGRFHSVCRTSARSAVIQNCKVVKRVTMSMTVCALCIVLYCIVLILVCMVSYCTVMSGDVWSGCISQHCTHNKWWLPWPCLWLHLMRYLDSTEHSQAEVAWTLPSASCAKDPQVRVGPICTSTSTFKHPKFGRTCCMKSDAGIHVCTSYGRHFEAFTGVKSWVHWPSLGFMDFYGGCRVSASIIVDRKKLRQLELEVLDLCNRILREQVENKTLGQKPL